MTGTHRIIIGDVLDGLRTLADGSVQCAVTSPPYWGLRDYGVAGQIGLEPTPAAYLERMVEVFREVRRVLRDDATCWVNMGDGYNGSGNPSGCRTKRCDGGQQRVFDTADNLGFRGKGIDIDGLKPKDLIGMPWRLAFALQADGWWLRSDIIWAKPNPMPESVTDRPTKAHEYIFLLTKAERYYFDAEAVKEGSLYAGHIATSRAPDAGFDENEVRGGSRWTGEVPATRNIRTVWTIPTQAYPEAHFATFPEEIPRRCILAGTSEKGCCPKCGAGWVREVERSGGRDWRNDTMIQKGIPGELNGEGSYKRGQSTSPLNDTQRVVTTGWRPGCSCPPADPVPCVVLDPFSGSGTTGAVACGLGRDYIGIELNPEYAAMSERRIGAAVAPATFRDDRAADSPLFSEART